MRPMLYRKMEANAPMPFLWVQKMPAFNGSLVPLLRFKRTWAGW